MADRGIIFSAPMVRALLDGRKVQTRRLPVDGVPPPPSDDVAGADVARHRTPYLDAYCSQPRTLENLRGMSSLWCWWTRDDRMGGEFRVGFQPGDRLWVRERCRAHERYDGTDIVVYEADGAQDEIDDTAVAASRWVALHGYRGGRGQIVSSRHMPRWASRLTLTVTGVKIERLHTIDEAGALDEGVTPAPDGYFYATDDLCGSEMSASPRGAFSILWDRIHGRAAWDRDPWIVALTFTVWRTNIDATPRTEVARHVA